MEGQAKKHQGFLLRLPGTTRAQAVELAQREGVSLNQFISLAVAEKLTRLEMMKAAPREPVRPFRPPYISFPARPITLGK